MVGAKHKNNPEYDNYFNWVHINSGKSLGGYSPPIAGYNSVSRPQVRKNCH